MIGRVLIITAYSILCYRLASGDYCTESYECDGTCYATEYYYTKCSWWKSCKRSRVYAYTCNTTCTREVCCSGFGGPNCDSPLCDGQLTCPNGGSCLALDTCKCASGFYEPKCEDINECDNKNGNCEQKCVNILGSYRCDCNEGYMLTGNGKTCSDVDECAMGTSECDHICYNTIGSYTCDCDPGYVLALDEKLCEDVDECSDGSVSCHHLCANTNGSYSCYCSDGFTFMPDGQTCTDINECLSNNGGCEHTCKNEIGSFICECPDGYRISPDGLTCEDINECEGGVSGCTQTCINTAGLFECACSIGYLLDIDEKTCIGKDNCESVICQNGGTCLSGFTSFTCLCQPGYTGTFCQSDVNECDFLNGGCQDTCVNHIGSFTCRCNGNTQLGADGFSCTGGQSSVSIFERLSIPRKLLPVGCFTILLSRCTDSQDLEIFLSSTSEWYTLKSDNRILYTHGIVFAEVNSLSVPVSIHGIEIYRSGDGFSITIGANDRSVEDGLPVGNSRTTDCVAFDTAPSDIFDFVSSGSFLRSFLSSTSTILPDWLRLSSPNVPLLDVQALKTDLTYGSQMDSVPWCEGAPVIPSHLYSVFRFDSSFSLSVYGNTVELPKPLQDRKFCLIVDICQNHGGSMFLMVPEESQKILTDLEVFRNMYENQNMLVYPRGIGISVVNGINVHYGQSELLFWNGDHTFRYPIFERADLWIGGGLVLNSSDVRVEAEADLYLAVPSPGRILTRMFIDEWNSLIRFKLAGTYELDLKLLGNEFTIVFEDVITASVDAYMSVGGSGPREWCGDYSNPPGIFLTSVLSINPFQTIPFLRNWVVESRNTLYAFVFIDPSSRTDANVQIDLVEDIIQIDNIVKKFETVLVTLLKDVDSSFSNLTKTIAFELRDVIDDLRIYFASAVTKIQNKNFGSVSDVLTEMWQRYRKIDGLVTDFLDTTEYNLDTGINKLKSVLKNETAVIERKLEVAIRKLTQRASSAVEDYMGYGFKFRTTLSLFGLKVFGIDVEIVYSKRELMMCSRFEEVRNLLEGKEALHFLGRYSKGIKFSKKDLGRFLGRYSKDIKFSKQDLGRFLSMDVGFGIGGAIAKDTNEIIVQLTAYVNMLGIKITVDVFITEKRLYIYLEGSVWEIFYAQIDISADIGFDWFGLTYRLEGRFVAKSRKKRQTQAVSTSFQSSYLDALTKVVNFISTEADKRLSQAQYALTVATEGLSKAQEWLDKQKEKVAKANRAFDTAVAKLERAKDKLDEAKEPFEKALAALEKAQKNVDKLCKIRTCRKICIPGVKCRRCSRKVGWVRISYPCCRFSSCMISFPDPFCVAANIACRIVRAVAFLALELAQIFVRTSMVAFDLAKAAVSTAQFLVDKSRIILDVAVGVLDLASLSLEAAKFTLQVAQVSLEVVKHTIHIAAKVLEFVLLDGLKKVLDVRNCGFSIEMTSINPEVFEVFCEVNAFSLGWKKIVMRINFKNPLQSIWQAAKATIKLFMDILGGVLSGRKKREISFVISSKMNVLLREIRASGEGPYNSTISTVNDTINIVNITQGFSYFVDSDYDNRVLLFQEKCSTWSTVYKFLQETWKSLFDLTSESKIAIDQASNTLSHLESFSLDELAENLTLENSGIDIDYAQTAFNLTAADLQTALEESRLSLYNDSLLGEINLTNSLAKEIIKTELTAVNSSQILSFWIQIMDNITADYFESSECVGFQDCLFFAVSVLYDLYAEETVPNLELITNSITEMEDVLLELIQNSSQSIHSAYNKSLAISAKLQTIYDHDVFCSEPPRFVLPLQNLTVLNGTKAEMRCYVTAQPSPSYWWYRNGELLLEENGEWLEIFNITSEDEAAYQCQAGNAVANITSNEAYLHVIEASDAAIVCAYGTGDSLSPAVGYLTCEYGCCGTIKNQKCCDRPEPDADKNTLVIVLAVLAGLGAAIAFGVGALYIKHVKRKIRTVAPALHENDKIGKQRFSRPKDRSSRIDISRDQSTFPFKKPPVDLPPVGEPEVPQSHPVCIDMSSPPPPYTFVTPKWR